MKRFFDRTFFDRAFFDRNFSSTKSINIIFIIYKSVNFENYVNYVKKICQKIKTIYRDDGFN
jgi:hypothetical protein